MSYSEGSQSFNPVFSYGDKKELNAFLANNKISRPYPLIWLLYPYSEKQSKKRVNLKDLVLILAVNTKLSLSAQERHEKTMKKILIPLLNNVIKVFTRAVNVDFNSVFEVVKFHNYSDNEIAVFRNIKEESKTIDLWDAIKVTLDLSINTACLKSINMEEQKHDPPITVDSIELLSINDVPTNTGG